MTTRAIVVMAKIPRAGRVKTRLAGALGPEGAAELYAAFLGDVLELAERAAHTADARCVLAVALASDESLSDARKLASDAWSVVEQSGQGLGARIESARQAGDADEVVVIGSDSPTMPPARIEEAFAALSQARTSGVCAVVVGPTPDGRARGARAVVVGPTTDGGYDLIAFHGPEPALLQGIPWSTGEVMDATRRAASSAGVTLVELSLGYDVDVPEDLLRAFGDTDSGAAPRSRPLLARALDSLPR